LISEEDKRSFYWNLEKALCLSERSKELHLEMSIIKYTYVIPDKKELIAQVEAVLETWNENHRHAKKEHE
jgi:hypothetical protein